MGLVVDASICAVWALADESYPLADRTMAMLSQEAGVAPAI